jgi:hypothetical protein
VEPISMLALTLGTIAAIITSLAIIYTKVLRPGWRVLKRMGEVTEVVVRLPEWQDSVDTSLREVRDLVEQHTKNHN